MHQFETGFFADTPAWHGLGTVVDGAQTAEDAIILAGLDWHVDKEKVFLADGSEIPNKVALVRDSDRFVLGVHSDEYSVFMNKDLFDFASVLLGASDNEIRIQTAGSLDHGRRVWLLAHLPRAKILGREIDPYFVLANSFDGSLALTGAMTPTVVVCANTLNVALSGAKRKWSIRHSGDLASKQRDAERTLGFASQYMTELEAQAEYWQQSRITADDLNSIVDMVFPIDNDMTPRIEKNLLTLKNQFYDIWNNKEDLKLFHKDAWGVYNAFADFATHVKPIRRTSKFQENLFASFIDGNKILERAQKAIELVVA